FRTAKLSPLHPSATDQRYYLRGAPQGELRFGEVLYQARCPLKISSIRTRGSASTEAPAVRCFTTFNSPSCRLGVTLAVIFGASTVLGVDLEPHLRRDLSVGTFRPDETSRCGSGLMMTPGRHARHNERGTARRARRHDPARHEWGLWRDADV